MKKIVVTLVMGLLLLMNAQAHAWTKVAEVRTVTAMQRTTDGGYILLCDRYRQSHVNQQSIGLLKSSAKPALLWQSPWVIEDNIIESGRDVKQTKNGGYIAVGTVYNKLTPSNKDIVIYRVSSNGSLIKRVVIGTDKTELAYYVQETADGGFLIIGRSYYYHPQSMGYLLKVNSTLKKVWDKPLGSLGVQDIKAIQTPDGGCLIAVNHVLSGDGTVLMVKLDANGNDQKLP